MIEYLRSIWGCRFFWLSLIKLDLRQRYRRSVLGVGWSLLNPIAMTAILCAVFCQIFHQGVREYAPYLLTGLAAWHYLLNVALHGCQCYYLGEAYIRQYPAPLAIYPLRTALGAAFHFLLALAVALVMVGSFKGFSSIASLLVLVPNVIILFILGWSLAALAGAANVLFQDTQHLLEIGFQLLFYGTPIMYRAEQLGDGKLAWIVRHNPLVAWLQLIRDPVLEGRLPSLETYAIAGVSVFATAGLAAFSLVRLQRRLIFYL